MFDATNAACAGKYADTVHEDIFFPEMGEGHAYAIAKAKLLCNKCPIALECFKFAMEEGYEGVWGGTTTNERKKLRISPRQRREHIIKLALQAK